MNKKKGKTERKLLRKKVEVLFFLLSK